MINILEDNKRQKTIEVDAAMETKPCPECNGEGWISVKEKLPESGENVLIHHKQYGIGIGYCIPLDGSFAGTFHGVPVIDESKQTTHWMKLPCPPAFI